MKQKNKENLGTVGYWQTIELLVTVTKEKRKKENLRRPKENWNGTHGKKVKIRGTKRVEAKTLSRNKKEFAKFLKSNERYWLIKCNMTTNHAKRNLIIYFYYILNIQIYKESIRETFLTYLCTL